MRRPAGRAQNMANRQALAWCRRCSRLGLGGRRHQAWRDSPSSDWQRKGALAPLSEQAGSCNSGRALRRKRATGLKLPGTALRTEMRRPAGRAQNMANRQALAWCRRCSRLGLGGRRHQAWRDSPSSDWQRKGALAPFIRAGGFLQFGAGVEAQARDGAQGRRSEKPCRETARGRGRSKAATAQAAEGRAAVVPADRDRAISGRLL